MSNTGRSCRRRKSKSVSVKPSRKTRTKTRKPKYLSLVHLDENQPLMAFKKSIINGKNSHRQPPPQQQQQQLNLFPLHPENLVEDKDTQYDNVCLLFNSTEEDNVHAVSLNGILDDESSDFKNETTTATTTSEDSPLSPCSTYGGGYSGEDHTRWLVESAMKGKKGRYESEEKWVVYSEVVEKKEMEEVSSCGGDGGGDAGGGGAWCMISSSKKKMKKLLALKLDYEEIMNAWSDKGPLYIEGGDQSPQTVPNLHDAAAATVVGDAWGNASIDLWRVPEMISNDVGGVQIKEEVDVAEDWKRGHREASVLRYKEKRQNRLFSKRIRYEVRKLNAEKRPRLKGRFVKRD